MDPAKGEWAEALAEGDAAFTERFGVAVERDWSGFPEALALMLDAVRRAEPQDWRPHLFFDDNGALVGMGGWKGDPVDGVAELGHARAPARQGRSVAETRGARARGTRA